MLLRVTKGRGNLIEYVIARSAATWQSYRICHCEERRDVAIL